MLYSAMLKKMQVNLKQKIFLADDMYVENFFQQVDYIYMPLDRVCRALQEKVWFINNLIFYL